MNDLTVNVVLSFVGFWAGYGLRAFTDKRRREQEPRG